MSEFEHRGGQQQSTKQLFIAMRTPDRRSLISPTNKAPDLFSFEDGVGAQPSIESRAHGLMRTRAGVTVNSDHLLRSPANEPLVRGYAVYLNKVTDEALAQPHTSFAMEDVGDLQHDLLTWSEDEGAFSTSERRIFRIKAELFRQVLNLYNGKSIT